MTLGQFMLLLGQAFRLMRSTPSATSLAVWTGSMLHRFLSGLTTLEDEAVATGEAQAGVDA